MAKKKSKNKGEKNQLKAVRRRTTVLSESETGLWKRKQK